MIRVLRSTECPSCSGDYGYPCCCVMLTANLIADILPPDESREFVRQLFFEQCSDSLGSGDREELLERFFADRAGSGHGAFETAVAEARLTSPRSGRNAEMPPRSGQGEAHHADRN